MYDVLVMGAGNMGSLIACLLTGCGEYTVHLADLDFSGYDVQRLLQAMPEIKTIKLDVKDHAAVQTYIKSNKLIAVISCLPYFLNTHMAEIAKAADVHYFDLTEDVNVTNTVKNLALNATKAFVPQCGLAPGFIGIVTNELIKEFDVCHHAKLRVGALPASCSNGLNYSLTWSTDGLINQYGNPCHGIESGKWVEIPPLTGLETLQLDGSDYEAFNTSGGIGSLGERYLGKVQTLNYKTIRYPGHCEKMRFLMMDLQLNQDRDTLKRILEHAIPKTYQDMVIIYVSVEGQKKDDFVETSYVRKIYPQRINGLTWTAIQVCTCSSICAVIDNVLARPQAFQGLVLQDQFRLSEILSNRFGKVYA